MLRSIHSHNVCVRVRSSEFKPQRSETVFSFSVQYENPSVGCRDETKTQVLFSIPSVRQARFKQVLHLTQTAPSQSRTLDSRTVSAMGPKQPHATVGLDLVNTTHDENRQSRTRSERFWLIFIIYRPDIILHQRDACSVTEGLQRFKQ